MWTQKPHTYNTSPLITTTIQRGPQNIVSHSRTPWLCLKVPTIYWKFRHFGAPSFIWFGDERSGVWFFTVSVQLKRIHDCDCFIERAWESLCDNWNSKFITRSDFVTINLLKAGKHRINNCTLSLIRSELKNWTLI